jgi:pyruvate formate-lyase/glycerol dehydratase family glycyl radical enzyme
MPLKTVYRPSETIELIRKRERTAFSEAMSVQRREVFRRVFSGTRGTPQVVRVATALSAFLDEKDIVLSPDDLLAGHEQYYDYTVPPEEEPALSGRDAVCAREAECGYRAGVFQGGLGGHVIAGYERVLRLGFGRLVEVARAKLAEGNRAAEDFARASLLVCEAATRYALRYAERGEALRITAAAAGDGSRSARVADACRRISVEPPRSFFEAVQLLWLTHEIITCEQSSGSLSLGRLDQYLFPYYQRDIAAGTLSAGEAAEIIQAFWIKLAGMRKGFQHVVLGGRGRDGTYACNDLTLICLRATRKLRMDQPLLSVRCDRGMPEALWEEILDLVETGMGFPALFNDDVATEAKRRAGVSPEDAANYAIVGCVELSVPGKEFSHTEGLRVSWPKVIELMLNRGRCPVTGETVALHEVRNLDEVASFDEFSEWYRAELRHFLDLGARWLNLCDRRFPGHSPYPFLSSTMEGCLETGRDVTEGGTVYNFSSVNGCGMANAVNSLVGIRHLVFQERAMSLTELARALAQDDESLLKKLERYPKFGNDQEEPDLMMRELAELFCREVAAHENPRGGRFQAGLYSVWRHVDLGALAGNLPDGRRRGMPLASSLSPAQGTDRTGPTAVIQSITRIDHRMLGNGMVLDLKFSPRYFCGETARRAFRALVETYFRLGGMEIQFNVIDRATLREAQDDPAAHRDLIVRVSGFSAYFVDLDRATQDEIIARTEHEAV